MTRVIYDPTNKDALTVVDGFQERDAVDIHKIYSKDVHIGNFGIIDWMRVAIKKRMIPHDDIDFFFITADGEEHPMPITSEGRFEEGFNPVPIPCYTIDALSQL